MKKIIVSILTVFMAVALALAQSDSVKWQTFDRVRKEFYSKQKPILIYLYEQGDDSCRMMEQKTFSNSEVARYINVLFYPIKLNATTHDTITFFNGDKFIHQPGKKYHDLIYTFLKDSIHFPALVVFDKFANGRVFYGFKDRDHIFPILVYYAEEVYLSTKYEDWLPLYYKTYPPGVPQVISRLYIHWVSPSDLDKKMSIKPKKIFIDVYDRYKVSATIMRLQAYNNPVIANYLNTHFYPVTVEARSKDTIVFNGQTYTPSNIYPYHNLAIKLLGGKMWFPSFLVLDTNYRILDLERAFLTPGDFYKIITYFGDDWYKKMTFEQYLKQNAEALDEKVKQIEKYYKK